MFLDDTYLHKRECLCRILFCGLDGTSEGDVLRLVELNSACMSSHSEQSSCLIKHHDRCVDGAQIMAMSLDDMELDECVYFAMGMSNMGFIFGVSLAKKLLVRPFNYICVWAAHHMYVSQ